MENLAGREDCDEYIREELKRCRIDIVEVEPTTSEVPYTLEGRLGVIEFRRAWYYWVANGRVPFDVAMRLYEDPVGKTDIRVAGMAGNTTPDSQWSSWYLPDGRMVLSASKEEEWKRFETADAPMTQRYADLVFSDDPESIGAERFVESYHIDSELGLYIFANAIRELIPTTA
jgi:hypothetical protein